MNFFQLPNPIRVVGVGNAADAVAEFAKAAAIGAISKDGKRKKVAAGKWVALKKLGAQLVGAPKSALKMQGEAEKAGPGAAAPKKAASNKSKKQVANIGSIDSIKGVEPSKPTTKVESPMAKKKSPFDVEAKEWKPKNKREAIQFQLDQIANKMQQSALSDIPMKDRAAFGPEANAEFEKLKKQYDEIAAMMPKSRTTVRKPVARKEGAKVKSAFKDRPEVPLTEYLAKLSPKERKRFEEEGESLRLQQTSNH